MSEPASFLVGEFARLRAFRQLFEGSKYRHPIQEADAAEQRLSTLAAPKFDEFQFLRFRAADVAPFPFAWVEYSQTAKEYAALLVRVSREYDRRFP